MFVEFLTDDRAQGLTEYFVIFVVVVAVVYGVAKALGGKIKDKGNAAQQGW